MKRSFSVDPSLISLGAGSVAGAVGVGVAYPLDTIKTKVQAYAIKSETSLKLKEIVKTILKNEGLQGFYGGVKGVMLAQAFIKSAAFGSNAWALNELASFLGFDPSKPDLIMLALAAAFSGFATSFIVNPIERIKILMQADDSNSYSSEIDCATKVLAQDGLQGLVFRGIDATLIREVPGYALYFIVYSVLINTDISHSLGFYAPLVCGATAGVSSWIPVYPFDVVKT
jgi:solute carrier family 25 carnitine/acylcarnitine transporter 20/29